MPKMIFVVMPFSSTPTRLQKDLTAFFEWNLKERLEREPIAGQRFVVKRSDDTFNINEQVIRDLYVADIVIADLSGREANPNVMYELGVRLAVSNQPVILIREECTENRSIFDIAGFHTFIYSSADYGPLEQYILEKVTRFTTEVEAYRSPVLTVLEQEPSVVRRIEADRLNNRLTAVSHNIYDLRRTVMERIASFCNGKSDLAFPPGVEDFQAHFAKHYLELEGLDWSTLHLRVRPTPSLLSLMAEPPDPRLVGGEEYKVLTAYVNQFFNELFAIESDWTFRQLALFMQEAPILESLVDATRRLLNAQEAVAGHARGQFRTLLGNTGFGWHVAIQHYLGLGGESAGRKGLAIPGGTEVLGTDDELIAAVQRAVSRRPANTVELFMALERELREAGATGPSLEEVLNNFASQLNVDRRALPQRES